VLAGRMGHFSGLCSKRKSRSSNHARYGASRAAAGGISLTFVETGKATVLPSPATSGTYRVRPQLVWAARREKGGQRASPAGPCTPYGGCRLCQVALLA
jgi:hypothetical protein